jgi:hypothetical protein
MTARELVPLLDTWFDALLMAEFVRSPGLQVGDCWDLRNWRVEQTDDSMEFQHYDERGRLREVVLVVDGSEDQRAEYDARRARISVPAWLLLVGEQPDETAAYLARWRAVPATAHEPGAVVLSGSAP